FAAAAGGGDDRSLPVPLARRDRYAGGGFLGDDEPAGGGGEGTVGGGLQLRCGSALALRGDPARRLVAAPLLAHQAAGGRGGASLVRRARDGGDRLQPDAVGTAHREVDRGAGEDAGGRRLAAQLGRVPLTQGGKEHGAAGCADPHR